MITSGQVSATSAPKTLCLMPPGPCSLLIANAGTATPAYIGAGTGVTAANGFPVPSGAIAPTVVPGFLGGAGGTISVMVSSGSASISWFLSTATGQTGI